jgi:hypothetical protein
MRVYMLSLLLLVLWLNSIQAAPASLEVIYTSPVMQSGSPGQPEQKPQPASHNNKNTQGKPEKRSQIAEGSGSNQLHGQSKVEAMNLLSQVLDEIALLEDDSDESIRWRSLVLPKVAELAWDSNKERVKEVYIGTIGTFLNNYERSLADGTPRKTISREKTLEVALKGLIKGIEARDKEAAQKLWSRFYSLRKAALEKQSTPLKSMAEYAALSREALEYDIQGSMEIARAMLSSGVPPSFVQFLLDLKSRNKILADELFKYSLGQLARGAYGPRQAIILSHYAFQEDLLVLPTPETPSNEQMSPKTRFGILTNHLRGLDPRPSPELATLYVNAVLSNLSLTDFANVTKQSYVGEALFLVKKLEGYASKLGLKTGGDWKSLLQKINSASERLGLVAQEITQLTSLAEKTVTDAKQIFQPSEGIKERVAKAAEAKSPTDRTAAYSSVISDLADNQNFDEAQKLLSSVTDKAVKEKMSDYIFFRQVQLMIEHQEWDTLASQIERIGAIAPRFYLLVSAAQAAEKKAEDEQAGLLLQEAVRLIKLTEAEDDQAKMLLAVASVSGPKSGSQSEKDEFKSQRMFDSLSAAIRQLNDHPAYDYKDYEMKLFLGEKVHYSYSLQRTDLESCFEQLAKTNWENAKILASYLNSKRLRISAQVAQFRSILRK